MYTFFPSTTEGMFTDSDMWSVPKMRRGRVLCRRAHNCTIRPRTVRDWQSCKNLRSWVELLPGIFLFRPEIFWPYNRKRFTNCLDFPRSFPISRTVSKPSEFFQIISHFPEGFTTAQIFPDNFLFSGQHHNCRD